jgi:hypothetical protein
MISESNLAALRAPSGQAWYLFDVIPQRVLDEFDLDCIDSLRVSRIKRVLCKRGGTDAWLSAKAHARSALAELLHISVAGIVGKKPTPQIYQFKRNAEFEFSFHGVAIASLGFSIIANITMRVGDDKLRAEIDVTLSLQNGEQLIPRSSGAFWIIER